MMDVALPPGRHVITFHYLPESFQLGVAAAAAAAVALSGWIVFEAVHGRRRRNAEVS